MKLDEVRMPSRTRRPSGPGERLAQAEILALDALAFLAEDEERLNRFLALSGLSLAGLRAAATEPGFAIGILDYFLGDESLLVAFASSRTIDPRRIGEAHAALSGSADPT